MKKLKDNKFLIAFILIVFLNTSLPHADNDFGWHYRCGESLVKNHKPCIKNTFSYYLTDYEWGNPNFVYDGILFLLFDAGGFLAVSFFGAAVFTSISYIIYKHSKWPDLITAILVGGAFYFSKSLFSLGFRSQILSLLFLIATLRLFSASKKIKIIFLPLLFLIWANAHGGFFLGPMIFSIFIISSVLDGLILKSLNLKGVFENIGIFIVSCLVTIINPFGVGIYKEVYRHWKAPLNNVIAEWVSPRPHQLVITSVFLLILFVTWFYQKRKSLFPIVTLSIFAYFVFLARRNLPLFYFSYVFFLTSFDVNFRINLKEIKRVVTMVVLPTALFLGALNVNKTIKFSADFDTYCTKGYVNYPCEAVKFLQGRGGNIFNKYEWGGFLIWQLPEFRVFVDGRMPAWETEEGKSPYTVWLEILQTREGWNQKLDRYNTDYLLIGEGTFMDLKLEKNPSLFGYKEVFRSNGSVVYEKNP